jgi:triosephosphate isomerase
MEGILVINLKTNEMGTGEKALDLAKIAERVSKETGANIILAVQASDIYRIFSKVKIPIYSQHVDPITYGSFTGHVLPEGVKKAGARGTLLNHSERRIDLETLEKTIKRCKEIGLKTMVCTHEIGEAGKIARFDPDYLAFEDPELIGTLKSISKLEPESVKEFVDVVKEVNPNVIPLCGAGVANGDDVKAAIKLGTHGVLLATAVVKAKNQEEAIRDLIKGFE